VTGSFNRRMNTLEQTMTSSFVQVNNSINALTQQISVFNRLIDYPLYAPA
jgi:hypothetical protein